ncbi:MAG: TIGR01777 family protein [Micrococcales bacterium]|nr:TIGR01777 family protein [Micrococcales bacterium]
MSRIVIAGASGFIGRFLRERFRADGDEVSGIGRAATAAGTDAVWGDEEGIARLLEGSDLLLNLAGRSVNCRYTERNRAEILASRLDTTAALGRAVLAADAPPRVWMNSSTATIYRHAEDRPMDEAGGELGSGFSVDVARAWEQVFAEHARDGVRQVALRTAIVLGPGSVMTPYSNLARVGLGGAQLGGHDGAGSQMFSWVHREDVYRAIRFLQQSRLSGAVNLSAPNPVRNRELMGTIRRALGVRVGLPLRPWMLELGAALLRTETELVLKSRWVLPARLQDAGFEFAWPHLGPAVREILHRPPLRAS